MPGGGDAALVNKTLAETARFSLTPDGADIPLVADTEKLMHPTLAAVAGGFDGVSAATVDGHTEILLDETKFAATDLFNYVIHLPIGVWGAAGSGQRGHGDLVMEFYDTASATWKELTRSKFYYRNGNGDNTITLPLLRISLNFMSLARVKRTRIYATFTNNGAANARFGYDNPNGAAAFTSASSEVD